MLNLKKYILPALGVIALTVFIYITVESLTDRSGEVDFLKTQVESKQKTIDSLLKSNRELELDVVSYRDSIQKVTTEIDSLERDLVNYKTITDEKINSIESYTADELQSFFANRYNTN